jgi:hypothetical protein
MTALDPEKLVFIDESGFDTRMTRRFGRAARARPAWARSRMATGAAIPLSRGTARDRIDAPMRMEGAMDGDAVCEWAEQMLAPTLSPGDVAICDNLGVHKNAKARSAPVKPLRRAGAAALPARLFARPQPHRDGIRQTRGHRQKRRRPVQRHRIRPRSIHPAEMRTIPPTCRICVNLIGKHARARAAREAGLRRDDRDGRLAPLPAGPPDDRAGPAQRLAEGQ